VYQILQLGSGPDVVRKGIQSKLLTQSESSPTLYVVACPSPLNEGLSLSLFVLTAIFQQLAFIEPMDDETGGNNWSYMSCKAPVKSSPPTNQHPTFYRPDALPVTQTTVSMSIITRDCTAIFQVNLVAGVY